MENTLAFFTILTMLAPFWGWILLAIITGIAAYHRGRDVAAWAVLSFFVMGPFALICVLVMNRNQDELDQRSLKKVAIKQCPKCAEFIKRSATVCRYCGWIEGEPT